MDWQTCVSLFIVAGCVLICVIKLYRSLIEPTTGCGSCSACPASKAGKRGGRSEIDQAISLVQIDE